MNKFLPYISVILAMLFWSVSGIAIKHALVALPPFTMIVMRFTLAVLLMLIIGLICRKSTSLRLQKIEKKDIPLFLIAGFFQPFLYYLLETYSYNALSSPTIAEALLSTSPLLSPIFAAILLREKVTRNNILGIIISTVGMLLLVLVGSSNFALGNPWGILLAFGAVSTAVLYTVILRRIPQTYSNLSIVFWVQLISLALFYPVWGITEGSTALQQLAAQLPITTIHSDLAIALGCVAYLAVFASVIAFVLFCYTVRQIGVTQTNVFNNVRPVFTALWMLLFFGEQLPVGKWLGILLIILGLYMCQKIEKVDKY